MRRPLLHLDATVNSYDNLYSLKEISKAENGEAYSSATAPGVIIPCSLIVMTKVMMFAFCVCLYSVNPWVHSKRSPCLFKCFLWSQLQCSIYLLVCCFSISMSNHSSHSPLSPLSESNKDDGDHPNIKSKAVLVQWSSKEVDFLVGYSESRQQAQPETGLTL
uniref:Uncharacterized protein n=1 Tax=Opuntia streptacantha TaxID=393608 RepID=A0A7C8ZQ52_OPUST